MTMATKGYQGTRVNLKAKLPDLDEPFVTRSDDGSATSVYGHPIRGLYPSEDVFFKSRPEVAGMASEDGAIILNPYSQIPEDNYIHIAKLEAARHYMNNMGDSFPKFELTPAQLKYFRDDIKYNGGEQKWKETLISRILVGDPTAGKITEEQDRAARQVIEGMRKNRSTRQDSKGGKASRAALGGGEAGGGSVQSGDEVSEGTEQTAQNNGGPRIIVNPSTFRNEKDALCVAMNEAFRVIMEVNGFDPVSEPTERQRKFFSDTAYNDDELMLRRTILARICTFDTSVKDPTDEQLQEAMEFLDTVMEIGAPQNEWEQRAVKRIRDTIAQSVGQPRAEEPSDEEPPEDTGAITGAVGGGESEDDLEDLFDEPPNLDNGSLDILFDTRSNTEKETEQVINEIGKEGSAVVEGVEQLDPEGTKKALEYGRQMSETVNNGFDASTQLPNSDPPQITSTSSDDAQQPAVPQLALPMKNGHYVDDQGRVITKRAAEALSRQGTGTSPAVTGIGGRRLTAGEAAWQERREASRRRSNRNGRDLTVFI